MNYAVQDQRSSPGYKLTPCSLCGAASDALIVCGGFNVDLPHESISN
jgi:hypothetical protein